jgi:hypothetical protein
MKLKHLLPAFSAIVWSSLILTGCVKSTQYLQRLDDIGQVCKIKSVKYGSSPGEVDTLSFHYNILGDLDSATYPKSSTLRSFYFRYDNHRRLLDWINANPDGDFGFWYRYFYSSEESASPSTDTLYIYPTEIDHWPPMTKTGIAWERYGYDSLGRVSSALINGSEPYTFTYDAHGNLIPPGETLSVGSDGKVNFNRTSRVLQFLNWDYSVNNLFTADEYNRYSLPTEINLTVQGQGPLVFLRIITFKTATIEYDCK